MATTVYLGDGVQEKDFREALVDVGKTLSILDVRWLRFECRIDISDNVSDAIQLFEKLEAMDFINIFKVDNFIALLNRRKHNKAANILQRYKEKYRHNRTFEEREYQDNVEGKYTEQQTEEEQLQPEWKENRNGKEERFLKYLKDVGLNEYFPRKLTMKHIREIRLFPTDNSQMDRKDLPFLFISKLTSLDSSIVWKEKLNIDSSARDFIYAILHCSDNHVRRYLMEKFACCQLAITILLSGVKLEEKPEMFLWALGSIVKKWKRSETCVAPETRMVSKPVFTTAFIRFGDIPMSKSSVLNNVLGRAQGNETFRYFLSYEEESEYVYHVCGSVEAQWYLPMYGRREELLKEVTLMLNLRGDSHEFTTETQFMCRVSNAVFIYVDKSKMDTYHSLIDDIKQHFKNVFVIYLHAKPEPKGRQEHISTDKPITKSRTESSVEFQVQRGNIELSKLICQTIQQCCNNTQSSAYRSIESWTQICYNDINVDQDNPSYRTANNLMQKSFPKYESILEMKSTYLQLQNGWVELVNIDKTPLSAGKESIDLQLAKTEVRKRDLSKNQQERGFSKKMMIVFETLRQLLVDGNFDTMCFFMTLFQTHIETMVEMEIPSLIKDINELNSLMQTTKNSLKAPIQRNERDIYEKKLRTLETEIPKKSEDCSNKNISCEHFIRELGYLYEANCDDVNPKYHEMINNDLIQIAATCIREGYPLEILDGETAHIPIKWITGVLKCLTVSIKNPKIFVLSIIGIESNEKSTFLNCMFGVRIPMRAGRCTRGLYLRLLEVNVTFQKACGFQYLFIIDSEGLQSPNRTVLNDHTYDNLLATLSMCIGDLTLLNIGQEIIGPDMIHILQTVVHAVLRMERIGLVSKCRIIQQRVSDVSAAANNKMNMAKIKHALDKATRAAAVEEKIDNIREFADVFPLVEEDDLQYFPCLWMGLMSPPNFGYSDKIQALKSDIFTSNTHQQIIPHRCTLRSFIYKFTDVWNAVKPENFVFHFQNSFDALSNKRFRLEHNILIGKLRTEITAWELTHSNNLTVNGKYAFYAALKIEIETKCIYVNKKIDEYVKAHSYEEEVKRRQKSIKNETFDIGGDIERSIQKNTDMILETKEEKNRLPNYITHYDAARNTAVKLLKGHPQTDWKNNHEVLNEHFEKIWLEITNDLEKTNIPGSDIDIDRVCELILSTIINNTEYSTTYNDIVKDSHYQARLMGKRVRRIFKKGSGLETSQEEQIHVLTSEIDEIVRCRTNDLRKQVHVRPFQKTVVEIILNDVNNALKQRKVANEVAVYILMKTRDKVAKVCKECQERYEAIHSLQDVFEKQKNPLRLYFLGFFDEIIKTEAGIDRVYVKLKTIVADLVINDFNVKLLRDMRKDNCYNDKEKLIGTILLELCLEKSGELYHQFINNNMTFVAKWLRQKLLKKITSRNEWASNVMITKVNSILNTINVALVDTMNVLQMSQENNKIQITFHAWATTFLDDVNIKFCGINVLFYVDNFMISDIASFTENMKTIFCQKLVADITSSLQVDNLRNDFVANNICSMMKKDIASEILEHLAVCRAVCPFCGVNCHLQITGEHKHRAVIHYSQGVAGWRNVRTQILRTEPCTLLIASDAQYKLHDAPLKNYKDYKDDFPNWDITPIKDDSPITYWKWVMHTFNAYFAEQYKAKHATIPKEWGKIDDQEAIASVKEQYQLGT